MSRTRGLAALDPDGAARAPRMPETAQEFHAATGYAPTPIAERVPGITMAVVADPPAPYRRWRFFLAWCLLKLAGRIYPFKVEFYRTDRPWD